MPYCGNCGAGYTAPKNFCERCGKRLGATYEPTTEHDERMVASIDAGMARTDERRRRNRNNREGSNESVQLYIGAICFIAVVHGFALLGLDLSRMLNGWLGWLLIAMIVISVVFKVLFDLRIGYSVTRSLIGTLVIGAIAYGAMYGMFWILSTSLLHSSQPWFTLPIPPTRIVPTPTAIG